MKRIFIGLTVVLMFGIFLSSEASAHTPLLFIEDNENGTICLEGEFSDGSSAAGVKILIVEDKPYEGSKKVELYKGKRILKKTKLDKNGEITIEKSEGSYLIIFDAGPGHIVEKKGPLLKAGEGSASEFKLSPIVITDKGRRIEISTEDIKRNRNSSLCLCVLAAFRAAKLGINKVWEGKIPEREDIKIVSRFPTPCSIHCFQYITGTDGKEPDVKSKGEFLIILPDGTEIKDLSAESIAEFSQDIGIDNWNFIITRKSTNDVCEVQVKKDVFPEGFFQLRKKIKEKGMLTRKEISEFKSMLKKAREKFLTMKDSELFNYN